jgi:hypothetical protein
MAGARVTPQAIWRSRALRADFLLMDADTDI